MPLSVPIKCKHAFTNKHVDKIMLITQKPWKAAPRENDAHSSTDGITRNRPSLVLIVNTHNVRMNYLTRAFEDLVHKNLRHKPWISPSLIANIISSILDIWQQQFLKMTVTHCDNLTYDPWTTRKKAKHYTWCDGARNPMLYVMHVKESLFAATPWWATWRINSWTNYA